MRYYTFNKRRTLAFVSPWLLFILSCGAPLEPAPFGWEKKAELRSTQILPLEIGPAGLYVELDPIDGYQQLAVFDGESFDVEYQTPGEDDWITGVCFLNATAFMGVSYRLYPEGRRVALLKRTTSGWIEVFSTDEYHTLAPFGVINDDACWVLCSANDATDKIGKYAYGTLDITGEIKGEFGGYAAKNKTIFGYYEWGDENKVCYVFTSGDYGKTWFQEKMELPAHYTLARVDGVAASPEAFYFVANVVGADLEYDAIIKRTGPPGAGEYELLYLGWTGPGYIGISKCAFRDETAGVAVGEGASMYYQAPEWVREISAPVGTNFDSLLADPRGGFWGSRFDGLYWHP